MEELAAKKAAVLKRVADWQSEAEKALSEIAKMKGGSRRQQGSSEAGETVTGITVGEESGSTDPATHPGLALAEAKAAQCKQDRDTLRRLLPEEVAQNVNSAESSVLRNAKVAEALEGLAVDDGAAWCAHRWSGRMAVQCAWIYHLCATNAVVQRFLKSLGGPCRLSVGYIAQMQKDRFINIQLHK